MHCVAVRARPLACHCVKPVLRCGRAHRIPVSVQAGPAGSVCLARDGRARGARCSGEAAPASAPDGIPAPRALAVAAVDRRSCTRARAHTHTHTHTHTRTHAHITTLARRAGADARAGRAPRRRRRRGGARLAARPRRPRLFPRARSSRPQLGRPPTPPSHPTRRSGRVLFWKGVFLGSFLNVLLSRLVWIGCSSRKPPRRAS